MNLPEEKRSRIVSVMVREFALNGYRKASLNSIVKNSGISKGSLYQYFSSKEEIFLFIFDQFTSLVKSSIAEEVVPDGDPGQSFWGSVKKLLLTGLHFLDSYPEYFQLYLRVLFEHDVPKREELIAKVRLFSKEYFSPLVDDARRRNVLRPDVSVEMAIFCIDAVLDRFLQGYAKSYLDSGLGLGKKNRDELEQAVDDALAVLRCGLGG